MKRLGIVLLVVLAAVAVPAWAQSDKDELAEKVFKIEQGFKRMEQMLKDLSFQVQQVGGLGDIVKEISFELKRAESMLRDLQGLEKKLSGEIQPKIANLETSIAGLAQGTKEKFDLLSSRIFQSEGMIDQLNVRLKTMEDRVRQVLSLNEQVMALQERVSALEKQIKMPIDPQKADELTQKIAELREQLKGLGNVVSGLTNKVLKTEEGIAALQSQLEEQAAQLQKMQEESAALKKRLAAAESQMQTNMMIGALGVAIGALAALKAFGVF